MRFIAFAALFIAVVVVVTGSSRDVPDRPLTIQPNYKLHEPPPELLQRPGMTGVNLKRKFEPVVFECVNVDAQLPISSLARSAGTSDATVRFEILEGTGEVEWGPVLTDDPLMRRTVSNYLQRIRRFTRNSLYGRGSLSIDMGARAVIMDLEGLRLPANRNKPERGTVLPVDVSGYLDVRWPPGLTESRGTS